MATAETVQLSQPHIPTEESINSFNEIEVDLKKTLQHDRHTFNKHEPAFFAAVDSLTDEDLASFSADDLELVRIGKSAYGLHLFGKVHLPRSCGSYIHFRAFVSGDGVRLDCIHTEEVDNPDGTKRFRAIFTKDDPLEWFAK